jgi:hypothetical protein
MSTNIICHACSANITQLHKKRISGYIYQYCSQACAEEDFTTCSNCVDSTEISKKDCAQKLYGCCQQSLGGNLQYYCSDLCEGEDTTEFIRSFRIPEKIKDGKGEVAMAQAVPTVPC